MEINIKELTSLLHQAYLKGKRDSIPVNIEPNNCKETKYKETGRDLLDFFQNLDYNHLNDFELDSKIEKTKKFVESADKISKSNKYSKLFKTALEDINNIYCTSIINNAKAIKSFYTWLCETEIKNK